MLHIKTFSLNHFCDARAFKINIEDKRKMFFFNMKPFKQCHPLHIQCYIINLSKKTLEAVMRLFNRKFGKNDFEVHILLKRKSLKTVNKSKLKLPGQCKCQKSVPF